MLEPSRIVKLCGCLGHFRSGGDLDHSGGRGVQNSRLGTENLHLQQWGIHSEGEEVGGPIPHHHYYNAPCGHELTACKRVVAGSEGETPCTKSCRSKVTSPEEPAHSGREGVGSMSVRGIKDASQSARKTGENLQAFPDGPDRCAVAGARFLPRAKPEGQLLAGTADGSQTGAHPPDRKSSNPGLVNNTEVAPCPANQQARFPLSTRAANVNASCRACRQMERQRLKSAT